jgi:predicted enzyme related to lactoylglutathione lyase
MKYIDKVIITAMFIAGCTSPINKDFNMKKKITDSELYKASVNDTTPKVTGIGGIFFLSKNPNEIRNWYNKNLGLSTNDYGSTFESRNSNNPDEINYLQWSPFAETTKYFTPSTKDFMINYRVQNIEALVKNLHANGVTILDSIESYDYGKFVHIIDPEGNKIELWEPVDRVLTKIGENTTK